MALSTENNKNNFSINISVDELSNLTVECQSPTECSTILVENCANLLYCLNEGELKNLIIESMTNMKDGTSEGLSGMNILKQWALIEERQNIEPRISPKNVFGKS